MILTEYVHKCQNACGIPSGSVVESESRGELASAENACVP